MSKFKMSVAVAAIVVMGCAGAPAQEKAPSYVLRGQQAEACECDSVCPCVWAKDVTFQDCRSILAWHVTEGKYGDTDLKGITFALALRKSGKNVVKTMGTWEGTIYVSDNATPAQKNAAVGFMSGKWGKAFAKVDVKSAPVEFKAEGEHREITIGKVAMVKIAGIPGSNGKVPTIENPPFALIPKMSCAVASVHTYEDDGAKWDFAGRNGFYGPFEYKND